MEELNDGVLSSSDREVFVCGCLGVENQVAAFCVMTEETAELVEVSVTFSTLLIYDAGVVVLELIRKGIDFIQKNNRARHDSLLEKKMLFFKLDSVGEQTDTQRDV